MTDRGAFLLALATGVAAWTGARGVSLLAPFGHAEPWIVTSIVTAAALAVLAGLVFGAPWVVPVAICVLVGVRADDAVTSLAVPPPRQVEGLAELVNDPDEGRFGVRVILRVDGRRYVAQVPRGDARDVRDMLTGERIRVSGVARPFDDAPAGWVLSRHLAGRLSVRSVEPPEPTDPRGSFDLLYRFANGVHRTITAGSASFSDEHRALYLGLVMGDDRDQSELTAHRFRASGLTHLLAVSGQNVAFVLAVIAPLLERLGRRTRGVVAVAVLVVFATVTRADPSVLRASVMAALAIVALTSGRVAPTTRLLCVAVAGLLMVDPLLVHSVGFQLSVSATGGLLVLGRPMARRLRGPDWVTTPIAVTVAAQLATAPVLIALSGGVPSVATIANLLAGPAAGAVMMLGVGIGIPAGLVHESIASVAQTPARLLVAWVDGVARISSQAGLAVLTPVRLAVLTAGVLFAWGVTGGLRHGSAMLLRCCIVGAAVVGTAWPSAPPAGAYDIGSSTSVVVGACGRTVVHIDGGRSTRRLDRLAHLGIRRIDVLVVSGTDRRAGEDVAAQFDVREVVDTFPEHEGAGCPQG